VIKTIVPFSHAGKKVTPQPKNLPPRVSGLEGRSPWANSFRYLSSSPKASAHLQLLNDLTFCHQEFILLHPIEIHVQIFEPQLCNSLRIVLRYFTDSLLASGTVLQLQILAVLSL
jgi:hypothetical protein